MVYQTPKVVRPGTHWYAISLLVLVGGLGLAYWQIQRSTAGVGGNVRPVRDQGLVELDKAGSYSVYVFRAASQRTNGDADRAWSTARSATVSVRDERTGSQLKVRNVYETVDLQDTQMGRLVEFDVPAAGTYRVQLSPSLAEIKPAVRSSVPVAKMGDEVIGLVVGVFIGLAIGGVAVLAAVIMFFFVLVRRKKSKQQFAQV